MKVNPLVSTVIATYNRPTLLLQAMNAARRQSYRPIELIIVDDGSTAETRHVVETWNRARRADGGFTLRYVRQPNAGPAVARNRGARMSRGQYIQFLDDDDLMAPSALSRLVEVLPRQRQAALSYGAHRFRMDDCSLGQLYGPRVTPPPLCSREARLAAMISGVWFVPIHGYLFTRRALDLIGLWNTALKSQEDDEFLLRAALRPVNFFRATDALVYYRQHSGIRRTLPGKPGETVEEGTLSRLYADLAIREMAYRDLVTAGIVHHYRDAFERWHRRLAERYGELLGRLDPSSSELLQWLQSSRALKPVLPSSVRESAG